MDIRALVNRMSLTGEFSLIARNPLAQFGTPQRRYIGAELLPNRTVEVNNYIEEFIRYRSVIANAGTRYSPTQKKGGALVGSMQVNLAESDRASELTGRDYDALQRILGRNDSFQAIAQITNFVDLTINVPLEEWLERARWQAIVSASVQLRGDNGYTEDVAYSNPAGQRAAASATWSVGTNDPYSDVFAMVNLAASLGYSIGRIITSRNVANIMANNAKVQARTGRAVLNIGGGGVAVATGRASLGEINGTFGADGLPPIELYDLQYRTETGTSRFMPNNVMVLVAETGRDPGLDLGDTAILAPEILDRLGNTVGYTAIGRAVGQEAPGRFIRSEYFEDKPPRVWAEGWQTALPVITDPNAIFVITGIA
ncbi:MAG: major capsid protein [Gemmatimonadaceae bacterium]